MRKVINGKMYDTATAKKVARYAYSGTDEGRIYQKRTGEFFLYNEVLNGIYEYEIRPLSDAEAKEYCEEWLDGDEYEAVFGTVAE